MNWSRRRFLQMGAELAALLPVACAAGNANSPVPANQGPLKKDARGFLTYSDLVAFSKKRRSLPRKRYAIDPAGVTAPLPETFHHHYGDGRRRKISFTFDCGETPGSLERVLETLARYDVRSTFFLTGEFIQRHPSAVRAILAGGHECGNHSDTHARFYSPAHVVAELRRAQWKFHYLTGLQMAPYWRAPYLQDSNGKPWVVQAGAAAGYACINGSIAVEDWTWEGHPYYLSPAEFSALFQRINFGALGLHDWPRPQLLISRAAAPYLPPGTQFDARGAIVMLHTFSYRHGRHVNDALGDLIPFLQSQDYAVCSVSRLLNSADA